MLSPTKYPLLLLLFTVILATMTHAAPAAAGLERAERRGDLKPYEEQLRDSVEVITQMEEKLEEEKIEDKKAGETERPGAYEDIFRRIRTTLHRLKKHEQKTGEKDNGKVAKKVRKWYKWMVDVKAGNKLQKQNPKDKQSRSQR